MKNAAPSFGNYSARNPMKKSELDKQSMAQVMLDPNKEHVMQPLNLGFHDFDKALSREHREVMKRSETNDKSVLSPDFYTHHDNAVRAKMAINRAARGATLPTHRFENSPPRDQKMYRISDTQNLDIERYMRSKNSIDIFLEINNILPHQNTLAKGFTKGSHYDKVVRGQFDQLVEAKNFGRRRQSDSVALKPKDGLDAALEDKLTLSKVQRIENSDSKMLVAESKHSEQLRGRSKSIAQGPSTDVRRSEFGQSENQEDDERNVHSSRDILSVKNNKYMKQIENILDMGHIAKKLDFMKMSHMTEVNPDYKLTKNSGFSLNPQAKQRRKRSEDGMSADKAEHSQGSLEGHFYEQTTKEELEIMQSIRKTSDMTTLFSESQLSSLTLEQKMLAGLYIPRKKKDPNEIEIFD